MTLKDRYPKEKPLTDEELGGIIWREIGSLDPKGYTDMLIVRLLLTIEDFKGTTMDITR